MLYIKIHSDERNGQKEVTSELAATSATTNFRFSIAADRYGQGELGRGKHRSGIIWAGLAYILPVDYGLLSLGMYS